MKYLIKLIKKTAKLIDPEERKVVMKNFASLSVLQSITYLLPVIVLPYMFRVIGPAKFGLISFAQAFVQYFMILTDYGFSISATKEISLCREEHDKVCSIFSSVLTVKILLALLSLAIMGIMVYFIPKFRHNWMVYVLSFGTVLGNTLFPMWFFQGTEKMRHIAEINILGGVFYAASIFMFVKGPQDFLMVPLINSAVFLMTGVLGLYVVSRRFKVKFKFPEYDNLRKQLTAGWDIFISIVAINAYTTTRIFTVGLLTNNVLTGFYTVAEKVANLVQTFPLTSFSQAMFPRLSKIFHRNKHMAFEIMEKTQQVTTNISLIVLPLFFVFSPLIVKFICAGEYYEAVLSLRLLLISVFFIIANAFRVQFLLVCGKTHIYSRIHVVMAMTGLPLIFLFIYSFSYVGAAIATVIIEGGIFGITYFTIKRLSL
ncbi:MAG: flippase [Candidatus Omnitrophica bacterium]|nr:flippase [Candidatus Omnitrophota bacterium]MDD5552341.1 flippase [Candidatus Omnitrophota bacterium]